MIFLIFTFLVINVESLYIGFYPEDWWHCMVGYVELEKEYMKGQSKVKFVKNTNKTKNGDVDFGIQTYDDATKKWGEFASFNKPLFSMENKAKPNGHEGRLCGGDCIGEDLTNSIPIYFTYETIEENANKDDISHCWNFWKADGKLYNRKIEIPEGKIVWTNRKSGEYIKGVGNYDEKHWDDYERFGRHTIMTEREITESERLNYDYYVSVLNKTKPNTTSTTTK